MMQLILALSPRCYPCSTQVSINLNLLINDKIVRINGCFKLNSIVHEIFHDHKISINLGNVQSF